MTKKPVSTFEYDNVVKQLGGIFELLGIDGEQASLYAVMLKSGSRPASMLSKLSGFARGKTYDILNSLLENNLIQEFAKNGVKHFAANSPHTILSSLKSRENSIKEAQSRLQEFIPLLESSDAVSVDQAKIEFWRGDVALQTMWERVLIYPKTDIYAFFDYEKRWPAERGLALQEWDRIFSAERARQDVTICVICNRSPASDKAFMDREKMRRRMKLVEDLSIPISILIHESALIITNNDKEVYGVAIRDQSVIRSALQVFRSVWDKLPDYSLKTAP